MATKVIVCPQCESPLVPGRFSCQSCGVVVAAVASETRSFARAEPTVPPALEPAAPEPGSDLDEPAYVAYAADVDTADVPFALAATPIDAEPVSAADVAWPAAFAAAPVVHPEPAWPAASAPPMAQVASATLAWPAQPSWPPVPAGPVAPQAPQRTPAGAYLPPSAVLPPGEALPAKNAAANELAPRRSLAERFAFGEEDGPLGLPATLPGRTIALGAAIAGFGFLLPWAEVVIGSGGVGGFLDQWGLAGPGHWLLVLLLIAVGGLAVAGERTDVKVGTSTAAILLGALLIGLAFPYVMGPFREAVGVYVTLSGALVMIAGGLIARIAPRHDPAIETV
jgi:hypothetical protein